MKLEVGIYSSGVGEPLPLYGWMVVCEQEKVQHRVTNQPDCPVMVFSGNLPEWLPEFMEAGGVAIITDCGPDSLPFRSNFVCEAALEYIDLRDFGASISRVSCIGRVFQGSGLGKISVHENRLSKEGIMQDEYPAFIFQSYGHGGCWYSGLPFSKLLMVMGDTLREVEGLEGFSERVVSVDKHHIIQSLRYLLIRAFNYRGLPYVHLWYYPQDFESVFTFRVDVDGIFDDKLKMISDAALVNGFTITFFLNRSLCEMDEERVAEIDPRHEIGNHADVHNLYSSLDSNLANIRNCMEWLNRLNVQNGKWFTAPRGMWNHNLHTALEMLGFEYTSDFGCAIGGFPFYPYIDGKRSGTLQIPVNPFSAERLSIWLQETHRTDDYADFVKRSFSSILRENHARQLPSMLYSHPECFGDLAADVFRQIRHDLGGLKIWVTTVTQFARWWQERDACYFEAEYDSTSKTLKVTGIPDPKFTYREIFI